MSPITQMTSAPSIWGSWSTRTLNLVLFSTKAGLYVAAGVAFDQTLYKVTSAHEQFLLSIYFVTTLVTDLGNRKVRSWQQDCLLITAIFGLIVYKILHFMWEAQSTYHKKEVVHIQLPPNSRTEWRPTHHRSHSDRVSIADCDLSIAQVQQKYPELPPTPKSSTHASTTTRLRYHLRRSSSTNLFADVH